MVIFRYLFFNIIQSTIAVSTVLLLIVTSGRLAKYLSKASTGDLSADLVLTIIFYRIPDFLPLIIPLGLFVGVLLVYGRMYVDSEMIVLNACGVGKTKILGLTLIPAFMVSILVAFLSIWAAPASLAKVETLLEASKNFQGLALFREGNFQSSKRGDSVVYVEQLFSKNQFEGVFIVEQKADGAVALLRAKGGEINDTDHPDVRHVLLNDGVIYEGVVGDNDYKVTSFKTYLQKLYIEPQQEQFQLRIDALPTLDMLGSDDLSYIAALHWRFSLPATVIVVAVLAMALSRTDRRKGRYLKMLPAIFIYLLYIVSLSAMRTVVEEGKFLPIALWAVHFVYLVLAVILLFRDDLKRNLFYRYQQKAISS